jgi:hypothetical protein
VAASQYAQHFTPPCAVDLMYDAIQALYGPLRAPRVIDPACGQGALLRRAAERGITPVDRTYGIERDPLLAVRGLSSGGLRVAIADATCGLRWAGRQPGFDLVVANPPYGTGSAGLRELPDEQARGIASDYDLWAIRDHPRSGRRTPPVRPERVRSYPAEVLFLEVCVRLARRGGRVAVILPEGIAANARYRRVREWVLGSLQLDAVIGLPRGTFRRTGAAAKTVLVLLTKSRSAPGHRVLLGEVEGWEARPDGDALGLSFSVRQPQTDPNLARRLDPAYWHPECDRVLGACRHPLVPLGNFITKLTYGPIVTGRKPPEGRDGAAIVNQGQVHFCGVDLTDAPRAPLDSPWVCPRAMLEPGDVVLPRSGEGSLRRHKVAVFLGDGPACVGSFVDLVRLRGLNPVYLAALLKSRLGRAQVSRIANGVGVPNISFEEVRSLLVPPISEERQAAVEAQYRREVLPYHLQATARHRRILGMGFSPRDDPELRALREAGRACWQGLIDRLDAELLGVATAG